MLKVPLVRCHSLLPLPPEMVSIRSIPPWGRVQTISGGVAPPQAPRAAPRDLEPTDVGFDGFRMVAAVGTH